MAGGIYVTQYLNFSPPFIAMKAVKV